MSLFHRDAPHRDGAKRGADEPDGFEREGEPRVGRIDEDMAAAAETGSQLSDGQRIDDGHAGWDAEPLEESIDEPPHTASRYLRHHDDWAMRSRQRLNAQLADTCESCDAFVQRKPWQSVGIAALGGAFLALLLSRR